MIFCSTWTARDGPKKDVYNIGDNPQYRLEVRATQPSAVWVLLTRHITDRVGTTYTSTYIPVYIGSITLLAKRGKLLLKLLVPPALSLASPLCWTLWVLYLPKTLFAKRGKLHLKFTCPASTSTCLPALINIVGTLSGQNITCRAGQASPKVYLPRQHFHLPHHSVKHYEYSICPKHYSSSGASKGLVLLARLPFFTKFTHNLQRGKWLWCTLYTPLKSFHTGRAGRHITDRVGSSIYSTNI